MEVCLAGSETEMRMDVKMTLVATRENSERESERVRLGESG